MSKAQTARIDRKITAMKRALDTITIELMRAMTKLSEVRADAYYPEPTHCRCEVAEGFALVRK